MKIAYFSPLPPNRSGVADYSVALLPFLARHSQIDLWIEASEEDCKVPDGCSRMFYSNGDNLQALLSSYDAVLYHLGNSPAHRSLYRVFLDHPGVVVLHDFVLHHFLAGYYLDFLNLPTLYVEEMEYNYGPQGRSLGQAAIDGRGQQLWEHAPLQYPLNKRILDNARGVIVHSDFVRTAILATHPGLHVTKINHFAQITEDATSIAALRRRYGIPEDRVVVGSFGLATSAKRLEKTLRALERLRRHDVLFLLVGQETNDVARTRLENGMPDCVRTTGYVDSVAFDDYIKLSDICVNLRWPTMGETSGSLLRALASGKPCIVSNVGWFAELPSNCVAKVAVDETEELVLAAYLRELIDNSSLRAAMGANAQSYIRETCSIEMIAQQYAGFLADVSSSGSRREFTQRQITSVSRALALIGVCEQDEALIEDVARRLARVLGRT